MNLPRYYRALSQQLVVDAPKHLLQAAEMVDVLTSVRARCEQKGVLQQRTRNCCAP